MGIRRTRMGQQRGDRYLVIRRKPTLVRLHTFDQGPSFEGVLVSRHAGHYQLLNASVINETGPVELDGEAWVPNERVLFVQVLA